MKKTVIIFLIIIIFIIALFEVYLLANYAGKPTSEVPFWVTFFLLGN